MKQNTMLIGAFVAGLTTTYVLQKTKVFGSETRVFNACNQSGYDTNAPFDYTGDTARIESCETCNNGGEGLKVTYTGGEHQVMGVNAMNWVKGHITQIAGSGEPTNYWTDYTSICCPDPVPCPTCAEPEPCPEPSCPNCDSCCAECPDCSKPSKHPSQPQEPPGFMERFFGRRRV